MRYRNITFFVEAEEYKGSSDKTNLITPWVAEARRENIFVYPPGKGNLHWNSPHGLQLIRIGDMLVKDAMGNIFACGRRMFDQTYELVHDNAVTISRDRHEQLLEYEWKYNDLAE